MNNPIPKLRSTAYRFVFVALVLLFGSAPSFSQQGGITKIYTDFNGYWASSAASINPVKPDNRHNLLGFTWNGATYSTGVNDATLTAHGITFIAKNFQAFPVRNVTLNGTAALPAFGQLVDGVDNGRSVPQPFSIPANISDFLTDGIRGLDIGTGVANVPAGTLIFDFGSIIAPSQIGDGIPDILVSQIADPSAVLDSVYFTDGSGNLVGNKLAINHSTTSSVGNWTADFYNANGTLSSGYTKTDRSLRVWAADISAFGINAGNYSPALSFRYKLNGSSDPAFLAFNSDVIAVVSANDDIVNTAVNTPAAINVLANDQPATALNISSLSINTNPAHGTVSVDAVTGVVTYMPVTGYSGVDHFVYHVCNNSSISPQCDDAIVTINVGAANLSVTKTINNINPPIASKVVFTITAKNAGINDDYGIKIEDALPNGYSYVSAGTATGSYNNVTGIWTIGNLANGTSAVLTVTALVNPSGNYANTAAISGILFDPVTADNTATVVAVPVAASSDLQIVKAVDHSISIAGSNVVFTLTATNNGPSNATGVVVNDILPPGYTYVSAVAPSGTSFNNVTGIWNIGALANGGSTTLTITATVKATGTYVNTATISGINADPAAGNNSSAASVDPSVGIPVFAAGATSTHCQAATIITYSANVINAAAIVYSLLPASAGSINSSTGAVNWNASFSGVATISVSASGTNGPTTADHTVTVNPAATAPVFTLGNTSVRCQGGGTTTYDAVSSHSMDITYNLSPASAGTINVLTGEVSWSPLFNGTAVITANASGCNGSLSSDHTVSVSVIPTATIAYDESPYCATGVANVTRTGQTGGVYSSTTGLAINSSTGAVDLAASTAGIYTVTYDFSNGTCSDAANTVITISKPMLVINDPQPVCAPSTVNLTDPALSSGSEIGLTFNYYSDPAGTVLISNPNAISSENTYYVRGINITTGCMSDLMPVVVKINSKPSLTVSSDATDICKGSSVTLTAASPGNNIEWLNAGTGDPVVVDPVETTTYTAAATNLAGCTATATITVNVKKFEVALTASPGAVLAGNTVTLNSSANFNYDIISWMPQDFFLDQSAVSQSLTISDTSKTFSVIAKSDEGCLDTAFVTVIVNTNTGDFFIPNAFTPNNDGKNDLFKTYGSSIKEINMSVLNQWGQLLFETKDVQRGWDGNYGGHPQPVGVYVYLVKVVFYNNTLYMKKGTVNLIR